MVMKAFLLSVIFILAFHFFSQGQVIGYPPDQSRTGQYIEGAKVFIDILKLFKSNKPAQPPKNLQQDSKNANCNFCIYNSDSLQATKVTLCEKQGYPRDTTVMVVKSLGRECALQIRCGVYNCRIENQQNMVISWGDILINEKQVNITR
jgi:hypothetical protein